MSLLDMSTTMSMETMCPRLGDVKLAGEGVFEMRIDVGAGYRAYFTMRGNAIVILLCGGEKNIPAARHPARRPACKGGLR